MAEPLDDAVLEVVRRAEGLLGARLLEARPLEGGHSGVTLVAEVEAPRPGLGARVVIKAAPPGRKAVGRHDVLRQARGIAHAAGAVPVPEILASSEEGTPFFVMSFERGEAAEPAHDEQVSGDDAELVAARFDAAAELLGRLHGLGVDALLGPDDVPATPADELAKWERTLAAVSDETHRALGDEAFRRLAAGTPDPWRTTFVHGDYRLGNILFDGAEPVAVIDWEIWSVGDPRVDLGWFLTFCDPTDFPVIGFPHRTIPSADEVVAGYEARTGAAVPDLSWFLAFGAFKIGVVMAHNLERHRTGRHVDPFQEQLPPTIEHLLARAGALAAAGTR